MDTRKLSVFLWLLALLWLFISIMAIDAVFAIGEPHVLLAIIALFFPPFLPGGIIWIVYTFYLAYRVLPKVDVAVSLGGEGPRYSQSDFLLYRLHRLSYYYLATISQSFNQRVYPDYDFRLLPRELKLPLRISGHWMWLIGLSIAIGIGAAKLAEKVGVMPSELIG